MEMPLAPAQMPEPVSPKCVHGALVSNGCVVVGFLRRSGLHRLVPRQRRKAELAHVVARKAVAIESAVHVHAVIVHDGGMAVARRRQHSQRRHRGPM